MAFYQDSSEFWLSYPRLSIKHLLITAFLTPACLFRKECRPCKHLAQQLCSVTGDRCTGKNCNIGIQTIGKALRYFSRET